MCPDSWHCALNIFHRLVWPGSIVVRALDLVVGSTPGLALSGNNLGQVVHTRASVTNQYNLVAVKGRWCPADGTGHASQTSVVYPPTGSRPRQGDEHPRLRSPVEYVIFTFYWNVYINIILITTKLCLPWRFDLYQTPSSEEVVEFFYRFLPR